MYVLGVSSFAGPARNRTDRAQRDQEKAVLSRANCDHHKPKFFAQLLRATERKAERVLSGRGRHMVKGGEKGFSGKKPIEGVHHWPSLQTRT